MSGAALGYRAVDLNGTAGDWIPNRIDVSAVERVHIEAYLRSGTWGTAVLEVVKSASNEDFFPLDPVVQLSGATRLIDIDVHDAHYLQVEIDTPEGVAGTAVLYFYGDGVDSYQSEAVITLSGAQAIRIDEASATVTYVGKSVTGAAEGSAVWQIQRLTESGADLTVEWADGDDGFDNIWTSRAGLSYS